MYLLVSNDGEVKASQTCRLYYFEQAMNGYMSVIDISNPNQPLRINAQGEWVAVDFLDGPA
ncbi:MAG: hypothetical protein ACFB0C_14950 [Leptolyngbyaceae cyanobacterium]